MLLVVACFLPAISGGHAANRPWTMAGWEMGYLAHAAVWNFTDAGPSYARRIRPLTETQALCVAGAAVLSNWLLIAACVMAYLGHRLGQPRKWAAYALRSAVYAALLGTSATLVWVVARNLAPQVGCIAWMAAPYVLAFGLCRLRRAARSAAR
jgi:hypothetical protein